MKYTAEFDMQGYKKDDSFLSGVLQIQRGTTRIPNRKLGVAKTKLK